MAAGTSVQSVASSVPFHDFCSLLERVSTSRGTEKKKKLLSTFLEQWRSAHRALHGGDTASAVSAVKHSRRVLRPQQTCTCSQSYSVLPLSDMACLSILPTSRLLLLQIHLPFPSYPSPLPCLAPPSVPFLPLPPSPSYPSLRPLPTPLSVPFLPLPPFPSCPSLRPLPAPPSVPFLPLPPSPSYPSLRSLPTPPSVPFLPLPPSPTWPSLRPLPAPPSVPYLPLPPSPSCSTQSDSFFPAMRLLVPQVDKDRLPYGMKEVSGVFWDH